MTAEPGRFLLVELQPGVHPRRVAAFMHLWTELVGVRAVTDLAYISRETLDDWLLVPEEPPKKAKRA